MTIWVDAWQMQCCGEPGTSTLSLDGTAQVATWRQFTPYGAPSARPRWRARSPAPAAS